MVECESSALKMLVLLFHDLSGDYDGAVFTKDAPLMCT